MNQWVEELRAALEAEFGPQPPVASLATVDPDGWPHVRLVVCRRVDADGRISIVSDARSQKNQHLRRNPAVELAFWFPTLREQFRIAGQVMLVVSGDDEGMRLSFWRALSDASRALFVWPEPGAPREPDPRAFPEFVPLDHPPPDSFEVVLIAPRRVERLELSTHPHRRRCWRHETGWAAQELNP